MFLGVITVFSMISIFYATIFTIVFRRVAMLSKHCRHYPFLIRQADYLSLIDISFNDTFKRHLAIRIHPIAN